MLKDYKLPHTKNLPKKKLTHCVGMWVRHVTGNNLVYSWP